MKRQVAIGACLWTLLITLVHVQLNVGWGELASKVRILLGTEREEMIVGFLPVT